MRQIARFKNYFIGTILSRTDDVFEKVKAEVLFSFTIFFIVINIPYTILAFSLGPLHMFIGSFSMLALGIVLFILARYSNIKWAIYFYLLNHAFQNVMHFFMNNGFVEAQGILFFLMFILFGFLLLGRKWGFALTGFVLTLYFIGVYNVNSGYSLFKLPASVADPSDSAFMKYFTVIPVLLNIFLVSQFVKATQKAEHRIREQKRMLESNNKELEEHKKDILSSINYAKRIQQAVLPLEENIVRGIPLSFILYKPRDIVSGDFFWFHEPDPDSYIIVCADCTGHGVPGAFMTVIGSSLLTQIITENKITEPSAILLELDKRITQTLKQEKVRNDYVHDGMDLALLKVDKKKKELTFTSAKRSAIFIRSKEIKEFKGSKDTLGGLSSGDKSFEEIKMIFEKDDMIYLFTDGYIDQFGGSGNKKFMIRRFRELLLSIHALPVNEQKQELNSIISEWIGVNEQTDDITVIGIRF